MTHLHRWSAEPTPAGPPGARPSSAPILSAALEIVLEWAPAARAVFVAGSHASGTAAWVEHEGRTLSLSDVDLYVVLEDEPACRAARVRQGWALRDLPRRTLAFGLAAPLEAGFHTPAGFARLPARPGTLELVRHGRLIHGDARLAELVPRAGPGDVSEEEIALLLENRGCELLWSRPMLHSADPLARLKGRHATLKCALDLAGVAALLGGAYPDGPAARVAWARAHRPAAANAGEEAGTRDLDRLWDEALAWREGGVPPPAPTGGDSEWRIAVRGWARAFHAAAARIAPRAAATPAGRALAMARRAPLKRRVRDALLPGADAGPGRLRRVAFALRGTLRHRVHASAALLLMAAGEGAPDSLPPPVARALLALGVVPDAARTGFDAASRAVVRAWDRWLLDGQRTADPA